MTEQRNFTKEQATKGAILNIDTSKALTGKDIAETIGIKGITKVVAPKKATTKKGNRFESKSFKIDSYIYENYQGGVPFVTSEMSEYFRKKENWTTSDISGQLYAKRSSGLLENRKPTDEEAKLIGKGISIWKTTSKFDEMMKLEFEELEKNSEPKSVVEKE